MHVRFIADAMLGRLARWLRFLGFDTLYYPDIRNHRLIRIAKEQDRLVLTRDTHLIEVKALKDFLLIKANDSFSQLREVIDILKLSDFKLFSRCVECNGPLTKIPDKKNIEDSVPEFVFLNFNIFMRCSDCGKIYWEGTHSKNFREKIGEIFK